jgi:hypothetical protein
LFRDASDNREDSTLELLGVLASKG